MIMMRLLAAALVALSLAATLPPAALAGEQGVVAVVNDVPLTEHDITQRIALLRILGVRRRQGRRTIRFPPREPGLSDRYRGAPRLSPERCPSGCSACTEACAAGAMPVGGLAIDLGRCLFCGDCATACPPGVVRFTDDHRLAARSREDLVVSADAPVLAAALDAKTKRLFGR